MKKIQNILSLMGVMLVLTLLPSMARAQLPTTTGANVDNDMVVGFLMGFADNNVSSGGDFLSGLTSAALTNGIPMAGANGIVNGVNTALGGSAIGGNVLGSAFGSVFNGTGVSSSDPMQSLLSGYMAGNIMAQTQNILSSDGLNLGSLTIPGINGGAAQNGVGAVVTSLLGNNATAGAVTSLMSGNFLSGGVGGALSGIQAGAVTGLLQSLGASGAGSSVGVLASLGLGTLGSQAGLNSLGSLGGMAALGALNSQGGLASLGTLTGLSGLSNTSLGSLGSVVNQALQLENSSLLAGLTGGSMGSLLNGAGGGLTSLLANTPGGIGGLLTSALGGGANGIGGLLGAGNFQSLLGNAQGMLTGGTALAQQLMSGNLLGGALGNVLNNGIGSILGGGLASALGGGVNGLLGNATAAITGVTGALAGAVAGLGNAVSSAIGGMLGGAAGGVAGAVAGAVGGAVAGAVGGALGGALGGGAAAGALGLLNCTMPGSTTVGGTNPTTPGEHNPSPPQCSAPGSGTSCGDQITFRNRAGNTVSVDGSAASAENFRTQVMFRDDHGHACTSDKTNRLLNRMRQIQNELASMGHSCSSMVFDAFSTYRPPAANESVGGASGSRHLHCDAMDFRVSGVSSVEATTAARAVANREGFGGVGYYGSGGIHVDVRQTRVDWGPNRRSADCARGIGGPMCGQFTQCTGG
ncbi:MAG: DUF882 domain-containing protein [Alphaproteobacteria bacterium]|nr:DUF882 domain-containing protein [Alphaproteobacteria bacterium]